MKRPRAGDRSEFYPGDIAPLCASCRHVFHMGTLDGQGWTCAAFPAGVPGCIVNGTHRHTKPYPGDRGTRFEVAPL